MKKYIISTEAAQHAMKLTQMGANVKQVSGKLCYVSFDLGYMTLEYVYNINAKGKYFLERIKPYPLPIKAYDNEDDVIDIIEIDVEQFRNAANSSHVSEFITISNKLHETIKKFGFEWDLIIPRKIGAPHNKEVAIGAIFLDGTRIFNEKYINILNISEEYIINEIFEQIE